MQVLHKFLLAKEIVEETLTSMSGRIEEKIEELANRFDVKTEILDLTTSIKNRFHNFLRLRGRGVIHEILLISDKPDYRIRIVADERELINKTFSELQEISIYSNTIDAFEDSGKYIFQTTNIRFLRNFEFGVITYDEVNFHKVYSLYDVLEPDKLKKFLEREKMIEKLKRKGLRERFLERFL